ncbi:GNAT family N-acetyltransferase [Trichormus variabilis]|uniref:N-acetyltransferase domain-containing protein n=1 Tax=Trichormus variabilis SAG 1403-4b TaxID=447716 RepID=A0A433UG79_ANAVA|nr:GNAT family N-acetyltransferase [Trichormus variabilis]MBD2629710.1 GNAT family N-acetyltransferase [Trichormus variabilis FACHB-164]RUS92828.1 hypothetical protein DSM107003_47810 [Trichormus variabilis SAG 1403-4b]
MCKDTEINALDMSSKEENLQGEVSIDETMDCVTFELKGENLIFKRIPNKYAQEGMIFGLFREDGTLLGESFCRVDRFKKLAWYLDDIYTLVERKGYGTQLLEYTCQALWQRKKTAIILQRPGDSIAADGFNRKEWYEKHGFVSSPEPLTFMSRDYTENG